MASYFKPINWQSTSYIPVLHELIKDMSYELDINDNSLTNKQRSQLYHYMTLCNKWQQQKLDPRQQDLVDLIQHQLSKLLNDDVPYKSACGYKW